MNTFKSVCANCHGLLDVPTAYIGKHVKCTNCGEDFAAEPSLGTTVKAPKIAKSSKANKADQLKKRIKSGFSLRIEDDELIFHSYCRVIGWLSIIVAALFFIIGFHKTFLSDESAEFSLFGPFGTCLSLLVSGVIHFGAAQIIKLFHSIAYNIQAMKEAQDRSE